MLKQVFITSAGIFESKQEAFAAEWKVIGGKRFLKLFDEHGVETDNIEETAAVLFRSERAHNLVKDYLTLQGWREAEGNTSKCGMVYGLGFSVECRVKSIPLSVVIKA